jgi:hypothetical protein
MAKTTPITIDQADELEELITDYLENTIPGIGNPKRDLQDFFRSIACPKDVAAAIFMRLESVLDDIRYCSDEVTRGNCEAIVDSCKALDEYLTKRFRVTGMKGRNPTYRWMVWS